MCHPSINVSKILSNHLNEGSSFKVGIVMNTRIDSGARGPAKRHYFQKILIENAAWPILYTTVFVYLH